MIFHSTIIKMFSMNFKTSFFSFLFLVAAWSIYGQNGTIAGIIQDSKTKEGVIGAIVRVDNTTLAVETDFDGNFVFTKVPAGIHSLTVEYMGYNTKTIRNLEVLEGKEIQVNQSLEEISTQLDDVVITAVRKKDTDNAVISELRKLDNIAVGVSSQQIAKTQDRDASQIVRRVPGISIADDRFIIIRGLNERYNTVLLNDIVTPSTEVDVKSFSFDMVPSTAIERMLIFKSPSADLPADITGGAVKIFTKSDVDVDAVTLNFNVGHRQYATGSTVVDQASQSADLIGLGAGARQLPMGFASTKTVLNSPKNSAVIDQFAALNPFLDVESKTVIPDLRASVNVAKKWRTLGKDLTNVSYVSYSNTHSNVSTVQQRFLYDGSVQSRFDDQKYTNNVRLSAMSNWGLNLNTKTKIQFKNLFNQLASKETVSRKGLLFENELESSNQAFRYEQRSILSSQLIALRDVNARTKMKAIASIGYTKRAEPDFRRFTSSRPIGSEAAFNINLQQFESPTLQQAARFWSNMDEYVVTGLYSGETTIGAIKDDQSRNTLLKYGASSEYKDRYFKARWFGLVNPNRLSESFTRKDPQDFFNVSNLGPQAFYYAEGTNFDDKYTAQNLLNSAYVTMYKPFSTKISLNAGLRAEHNTQSLQSKERGGGKKVNIVEPHLAILPSANFMYKIRENQAIKIAFAGTVNRPEFRELAPFTYYDFVFDVSKRGNSDIKPATIYNVDARYEIFPSNGQMITIGAFHKIFRNPIEASIFYNGSGLAFTVENAKSAQASGIELEVRKNLSEKFTAVFNATLTKSNVVIRDGESQQRYLQGQSPYIINTGLYYQDVNTGWQANVLYNVVGKRISVVGDNVISANIYEMPRHVIDANVSKAFGRFEVKIGVQDLLNQPFKLIQDTNRDKKITETDGIFQTYKAGTQSFVGVSFKF
jgi:hypothetical protein